MEQMFKSICLRNLKIAHAGPVRLELLAALDAADDVVLEIDNAAQIDIAGIQLIESARKYAEQHGKRLRLAGPPNENLSEMLRAVGLIASGSGSPAFWSAGEATR